MNQLNLTESKPILENRNDSAAPREDNKVMQNTSMFVFGDSLSDTGNSFTLTGGLLPPSPPYFNGRFSNGEVAVEFLDAKLGPSSNLEPSNNFAFGGATTGRGNSNEDDLGVDLPGLLDEIDAYTARVGPNGADKNGLYIVWAGPNDFLDSLLGPGLEDPALSIEQGTHNLTDATKTLFSLGATNIVLPNMLNLGRLPAAQSNPVEAEALSKAFNASVALELGNLNFKVTEVDLFSVGEAIAADPAKFGFSNVTDPLLFQQLGPNPPSNPQEYLFWDQFHPTTQGHAVLADAIDRTITGEIPQLSFVERSGTQDNDVLNGTSGNDNIDGFAGNDILIGLGGDDRIEGWEGNDLLFGNQGNDILSGGDGADLLVGCQGDDIVFGGNGNDRLFGNVGSDILIGDAGDDLAWGGEGDDYILGGEGADVLWGNQGNDILNGGIGNDKLLGGSGNDRLDGGAGNDLLVGGEGNDQFVYRPGSGADEISDFAQGSDKLDLRTFGFTDFGVFTKSVILNGNIIDFGGGNTLQLSQTAVTTLSPSDFVLA
jgi:phospholipase/lecithinase/hemolysin